MPQVVGGVSVPAMEEQGTGTADRDPQRWSQGWRRAGLAAGMLAYPIVTAIGVAQYSTGGAAVAGYALVVAFCCCYVAAMAMLGRGAERRITAVLGCVMTALFLATLPFAHEYAFFLCAVLVSFTAALLPRHGLVVIAAAALAALVVPWAVRPWHGGLGWLEAIAIVFTALTVYAFREIALSNRALVAARAEVADLASQAERDRIARDLHDLLGHSLTVITVKSGLARRLAAQGSPRAIDEITEVEQLSRQALRDVRAAVTGYREVTLAGELARGRELLRAAGIEAELPSATDAPAGDRSELFGWAVREGLTNVVRHARATRCTVELTPASVEIRDDGVGGTGTAGNGLTGLRERAAVAGGTVRAGPGPEGGWVLRVSVPASPGDPAPAYEGSPRDRASAYEGSPRDPAPAHEGNESA